jgi:hypothetical protein
VRFIGESGRHLLALINDILDLSKVEAGRMDLDLGPVRLGELLESSLVMVKEKCLKHQIGLALGIAPEVADRVIRADARKLKQVLYNLLSNSAKFTPDGGRITVEARLVTEGRASGDEARGEPLAATSTPGPRPVSADWIEVAVQDTGIGLSPELLEKVFDPFYQVKSGTRDKTPGTGLGLPLTRKLVELHGGRVWMTSAGEGRGCCVTFRVPVEAKKRAESLGDEVAALARDSWVGGRTAADIVGRAINFCSRRNGEFSVCGLHLTHTRPVEPAGRIRRVIQNVLRSYDILTVGEEGEEYLVLIETDREAAETACRRLREALEASEAGARLGFAVATYPKDGATPEELLRKALENWQPKGG